jgi:hypothetical protein
MRIPESQRPSEVTSKAALGQRTLTGAIAFLTSHGYRVLSQTDQSAQLVKPKQFSFLWCVLGCVLFLPLGVLYVIYYLAKQDTTVYLWMEDGVLKSRAAGG